MTTTPRPLIRVLRNRDATLFPPPFVLPVSRTPARWLAAGGGVKAPPAATGLAPLSMSARGAPTLSAPALGPPPAPPRRKPLLIAFNLLPAALLPTLLAVDSTGRLWLLFAVLFLYGASSVVDSAAESALVTAAVPAELLGDFNGLRTTIREGMKLLAPLAGAGLYAACGGPSVALLDAATFLCAAGLYACVRVREERPEPATRAWRAQTAEGARFLWRHPGLRPLVLAGGATMLFTGVCGALIYAVVAGLGHSPAYTGTFYAVQGAGSVVVGLASGPTLRRLGERRFAAYGIALTAVAVAARAVPSDAVALACGLASGVGLPCVLIAALTAVQRGTPDALLGRVGACADTLVLAPNVLGLALGAGLVELIDYRPLLLILGVALLATAALLLQSPASAERTASRSRSDANPA